MPLHLSTWAIMKNIVAKNGFSGLFTGLIPRLIKIAPACAIMISTYEFGKAFFPETKCSKTAIPVMPFQLEITTIAK